MNFEHRADDRVRELAMGEVAPAGAGAGRQILERPASRVVWGCHGPTSHMRRVLPPSIHPLSPSNSFSLGTTDTEGQWPSAPRGKGADK